MTPVPQTRTGGFWTKNQQNKEWCTIIDNDSFQLQLNEADNNNL